MTALIAIDWGTSRFRAYRAGAAGDILEQTASDEGMGATPKDGFERVLLKNCGAWFQAYPLAPVMMAGMVGSRNGWLEVPYAACPAGVKDIAGGAGTVRADGREVSIVPGLICRRESMPDVMRGEETLIIGARVDEGTIVLPGTHSKWARIRRGRIESFKTYMTGEFFALLTKHSVLRLLAETPVGNAGFAEGLRAAQSGAGLTAAAFSARTRVLDGLMPGQHVEPYLSGLLIGLEIQEALSEAEGAITVVADGVLAETYGQALESHGVNARILTPHDCLIAGLLRLAEVRRSSP